MRLFPGFALGLLLSLWLLTFNAHGQITRYVSTTGLNTNPVSATSWPTSTTDLQGAIDASQPGDVVWVAAGVYKPTSGSSFAMRAGVAIYGGFVGNETALGSRPPVNPVTSVPSGSTLLGNGSRVITNPSGLTTTAVLDGFVITGGSSVTAGGGMYNFGSSPSLRNCLFWGNSVTTTAGSIDIQANGGAIYNASNSSPILTNCSLQSNSALASGLDEVRVYGGAIYNESNSSPVLTNCSLTGNIASASVGYDGDNTAYGGAIFNQDNSNPVLTNCSLQSNSAVTLGEDESVNYAYGGAIYSYSCSPMLTNCSLSGNSAYAAGGEIGGSSYAYGGAIYSNRSSLGLINCRLTGNSATANSYSPYAFGGAISSTKSSLVLTNCSLQGNQAIASGGGNGQDADGGAIYNYDSSPVLTNCSLQGNRVTVSGGGINYASTRVIYNDQYSSSILTNCIVWNDGEDNNTIENRNNSTTTATYSLFDNTTNVDVTGPGNLTTATSPFISPTSVALAPCSPAIDAGDLDSYIAASGPGTDLAGQPRIFPTGGRIDMGAVEYQALPPVAQVLSLRADESGCPVRLVGQGVGTSFVFTGPQGYVFSNVFRTGGTHMVFAEGIKQPGVYTLTATYTNGYCTSAPINQTVTVSRSCP